MMISLYKVTGVATGDITSATSTDAVNGGQLYTEIERAQVAEKDNAAMKADNAAMKAEIAELKAMMKALIAK